MPIEGRVLLERARPRPSVLGNGMWSGSEYHLSSDFVPEPVYPEFMPPEDEVLPAEEQPLPAAASPTTNSPGYVPESNPEDDLEEDDDEDPEEDPADRGDDDDDEDESSDDDEDEDVDIKGDEEEEEHLAPADSIAIALPAVDHALSGTPSLLPISLPTSSPPLHLISTDRRADRLEVTLPPQKRLGIALGLRYKVGESSSAPTARPPGGFRADYGSVATMDREIMRDLERDVGYGITDTWDEMLVDMPGAPATDDTELGRRMTEFTTRVRQDTDEIYTRLDDEQSERQLMAGRLNMLYRDRRAHARTARLVEAMARMSREAWGRSMDASDLARAEVMSLHTQVMTEFERQHGPVKGPAQPDAPEEAGSSS
ncbi:hypothetical protein Tco_0902530 [Tanacetum coccineum]